MQSPFVIVTGPQGCGKTLHASTLAAHLGCGHVVDGWAMGDGLVPGALHLTNEPLETLAVEYGDGPAPRVLPLPILREFADVALSCGLMAEGDGVVVAPDFSAGEYLTVEEYKATVAPIKPGRRKGGAA